MFIQDPYPIKVPGGIAGSKSIYCCECGKEVPAELVSGKTVYPTSNNLHKLPFWICPTCRNFVGCHHKTKNPIEPLGCIATKEMRKARKNLHALIDPLWQSKAIGRRELYREISHSIGWEFHTAQTTSVEQINAVFEVVKAIATRLKRAHYGSPLDYAGDLSQSGDAPVSLPHTKEQQ